jgi:hypothetical protein
MIASLSLACGCGSTDAASSNTTSTSSSSTSSSSTSSSSSSSSGGACPSVPAPKDATAAVEGFRDAWNAAPADRACALDAVLATDAEVATHEGSAKGAKDAAALIDSSTLGALALTSKVQTHHEFGRATWTAKDNKGGDHVGTDFFAFDADHKIAWAARFDDAEPASPPAGVVQAYVDAWGATDQAARDKLLATAWSADGRYTDPTADVTGRDAFSAHIAGFQKMLPNTKFVAPTGASIVNGRLRMRWEIHDAKDAVLVTGVDTGVFAKDGTLAFIVGHFDPLPAQ